MKKRFARLLAKLQGRPHFDVDLKHKIVFAFQSGGEDYYKFADINNLCCGRAFAAEDYYNELQQRVTRDYLLAHCDAIANELNSDKIRLTEIAKLNTQLQERLEMILDVDIIYKIASVCYFTERENPYSYDFKIGQQKILAWKKNEDVESFFLQTLIKDIIPTLDLSEIDLETYTRVGRLVKEKNWQVLSTLLSASDRKKDYYKEFDLLRQVISADEN